MTRVGYDHERYARTLSDGVVPFFRFVKRTGEKKFALCGAAEQAVGVAEDDLRMENLDGTARTGYKDKEQMKVRRKGIGIVEAAEALTVGTFVKSDANGKAVAWTAPTISASPTKAEIEAVRDQWKVVCGQVIIASAADGDRIEVDLEKKP